jgi:predicted dehydrogenase
MSTDRVKLGIVGCGAVSLMDYFPALKESYLQERVELVAVCDVVPDRARMVAEQYGAAEAWTDYAEMLDRTKAEALVLLTPIPLHFQQGVAAIEAGKHVYIQKTMTTSYREARELIDRAAARCVTLAAAPGQMLDAAHRAAKDLIERGAVGKVCFARGMGSHPGHENAQTHGTNPTWYYRPGGGPVMDVAVYPLHSLTGLLGSVKRVSALSGIALPNRTWKGEPIDVQMDDNTLLLLDFGESVFAELNGSFCQKAFGMPQIDLFAEKGVLQLGGWSRRDVPLEVYLETDVAGLGKGWFRPQGLAPRMVHTVADLVHFADCLRDGKPPINSAAHAAHVIEVIEKGYLAAKSGQTQAIESTF